MFLEFISYRVSTNTLLVFNEDLFKQFSGRVGITLYVSIKMLSTSVFVTTNVFTTVNKQRITLIYGWR